MAALLTSWYSVASGDFCTHTKKPGGGAKMSLSNQGVGDGHSELHSLP